MHELADAWAAGFIDGEGYFAVIRRRNQPDVLHPQIIATQRVRLPLDRLRELFGGGVYVHSRIDGDAVRAYKWTLTGAPAVVDACERMLPHLVLRRGEAEAARDLAREIIRGRHHGNAKLTPLEVAVRRGHADRLAAAREARR